MSNESKELADLGKRLHDGMIAKDPTAFSEIAATHMLWLSNRLEKKYPILDDPHLIDTAVVDALCKYQEQPEKYNPEKGSLATYLLISAEGDLRNLLARNKKHIQIPLADDVELSPESSEYRVKAAYFSSNEDGIEEQIIEKNTIVWALIKEHLPDLRDQEICKLLMENIRATDEFSKVLGIQDLSIEEQKAIVKRHKDRIKKTLQRHITPEQLSGLYE